MSKNGHLLANGFHAGRTWLFDLTDPLKPGILTTFDALGGFNHPHTFIRLDNGNILATFQYRDGDGERARAILNLAHSDDLVMLKRAAPCCGFEVAAFPTFTLEGERVSSTAVRESLAGGELDRAERLLGRSYSISGRVVRGDGLGRKLGFPTANVQMKHNRPPLTGIFAVRLHGAADGPLPAPRIGRRAQGVPRAPDR